MSIELALAKPGVDLVVPDGTVWTLTAPARFGTITLGGWCILHLNGMATFERIVWSRRDVPAVVVHRIDHLEIGGGTPEQHKKITAWWHKHRVEILAAHGRGGSGRTLISLDLVVE